jgi:hypothetical protein
MYNGPRALPHGSLFVASRTLASISVKFITASTCQQCGQLAQSVSGCTILGLAKAGLEVVEREIAHLVFQAVEIHGGRLDVQSWGEGVFVAG